MDAFKIKDDTITLTIEIAEARQDAACVRRRIVTALTTNKHAIVDFSNVKTLHKAFADECIAKLVYEDKIFPLNDKILEFKSDSNIIKGTLYNAIGQRKYRDLSEISKRDGNSENRLSEEELTSRFRQLGYSAYKLL